jgi:hypothetical protein
MADQQITELGELAEAPAATDLVPIVDVSDTTMDEEGTNKKVQYSNFSDHTPKAHASDHERAGSDEIDGDHLDIDFSPSNYTPATTPAEAANVDDLAAHLYGIDQAVGGGRGVFGDGSDGDVTISGNTTLTSDKFYASLTVNSGVTLSTDGWRVFVNGTLTNNGTIEDNGGDGDDGADGGSGSPDTDQNSVGEGQAGGNGNGEKGDNASPGLGGDGGAGGDNDNGVGGLGAGIVTEPRPTPYTVCDALRLFDIEDENQIDGGAGGGGGKEAGAAIGGGGGSGGGVIMIAAKTIDNGSGTIQANGGDGGDGETDGADVSGGGGGGGGGLVVLIYQSLTTGTEEALGGSGGASGGGGGEGAATAGGNGSAGTVIKIDISG